MNKKVILVDENDNPIGEMEKFEVHQKGILHRAFSIFIFNDAGELLLQKRANDKYHSANLWSNTCCSHPEPGELTSNAAKARLAEEMGIETELEIKFGALGGTRTHDPPLRRRMLYPVELRARP